MSIRAGFAHLRIGGGISPLPIPKENAMQVMLIFQEPMSEFAKRDNPAQAPDYWGGWMAFVGALNASGKVVSGNGLQPPHAGIHLRIRDGRRQVQDGPYADTKEHLGGYFILEVDSMDEALEWGARSPAASNGSVEVRPVLPPPPKQG
jgi:hypothetical protein